ncbi:four-carbon acid sugar kinase family protein [Lactobacillus sp. ESL0791]|uniref:four-carbon acid sugar kinase family protein n=1 Tax=Lactobacillus sp. ESL0791 TaxID=2983234 RepID=UPI0023F93810|nr:four-carbon acid sugar kinase family protein [Lactobacillus sp. ESL0791]MDF7639856.1 four-carbon acid sugar kinase family protein [Lactobacillus sp. ESL0791]
MSAIDAKETFASLPPEPEFDKVTALLKPALAQFATKIIVLDDDPTGSQTLHDISVYTNWSITSIRQGFAEKNSMFYILTNSRGLTENETKTLHTEIAKNICQVASETRQKFLIISRSDSTLRGHYPLETEILKKVIEKEMTIKYDGEVIMPFLKEGGRFTINDVHYVQMGEKLVPAGETEFAKDATFGFKSSNLKDWVQEKTVGRYLAKDVTSIELADLRTLNITKITAQLQHVKNFNKVIVNAADYCDVQVFVIALIQAITNGKNFIFRTAAALPKIIGGVSDKPLLTKNDLVAQDTTAGGLIIVGSHVQKSTEQLNELKKLSNIKFIEFNATKILTKEGLIPEEERVSAEVNKLLQQGRTVTVYTSRKKIEAADNNEEHSLKLSVSISEAITNIVKNLTVKPRFLIAKGGITSSDVGVHGLGVKRATVAGQIKPGIPVWNTGMEAKFPKLAYVIFPGNVGNKETLREVVEELDKR